MYVLYSFDVNTSTPHKRERKQKAAYDEMFGNLPGQQVLLDTLTDEDKTCLVCGASGGCGKVRINDIALKENITNS